MNITYTHLIEIIEEFSSKHLEVRRFKADFLDQLGIFSAEEQSFPILYASPAYGSFTESLDSDVNYFTFNIYCCDLVTEDRNNLSSILNTTSQILNDLHKYFRDGELTGINLYNSSNLTPINNYLLDSCIGWSMTITLAVDTYSVCGIPFSEAPEIATYDCDITYSRWQGPQGVQGVQGYTGFQGVQGNSGLQGVQGFGYQGTQGTQGFGYQGNQGVQGRQGLMGFQGVQGIEGPQGLVGNDGLNGDRYATTSIECFQIPNVNQTVSFHVETGLSYTVNQTIIITPDTDPADHIHATVNSYDPEIGVLFVTVDKTNAAGETYCSWIVNLSGAVGTAGFQGDQGLQGFQGTQGNTGFQGNIGFQGSQGRQGSQGPGFTTILNPAANRVLLANGTASDSAIGATNMTFDGLALAIAGIIQAATGSASAPSINFGATSAGIYGDSTNVKIVTGGVPATFNSGNLTITNDLLVSAGSTIKYSTRTNLDATAVGSLKLANNTNTDFDSLQLGGTSSQFNSLFNCPQLLSSGNSATVTFSGTLVSFGATVTPTLKAGDIVSFTTTGTLPTFNGIGPNASEFFYVMGTPAPTGLTFSISSTLGGTAQTFVGGTGTHTLIKNPYLIKYVADKSTHGNVLMRSLRIYDSTAANTLCRIGKGGDSLNGTTGFLVIDPGSNQVVINNNAGSRGAIINTNSGTVNGAAAGVRFSSTSGGMLLSYNGGSIDHFAGTTSGNTIFQIGGTFTDNGNLVQVNGTASISQTLLINSISSNSSFIAQANLSVAGNNGYNGTTNSLIFLEGATGTNYRAIFNGNSSVTGVNLNSNYSYANVIVGASPITLGITGSVHPVIANLAVKAIGTINAGGGTATVNASLYVEGATQGGVNNYGLYVNGTSQFQGDVRFSGQLWRLSNGSYRQILYTNSSNEAFTLHNSSGTSIVTISSATANGPTYFNGGQVGIGVTAPSASAIVQIDSTTQFFVPPRMTTAQRLAVASPLEGSMCYDTTLKVPMFYDGTNWISL